MMDNRNRPTVTDVLVGSWRLVLATTVACAVAVYLVSLLVPVRWDADATIYLADPTAEGIFGQNLNRTSEASYAQTEAARITSNSVVEVAAQELGEDPAALQSSLSATALPELDVVAVSASGASAGQAADRVNATVTAYQEVVAEERRKLAEQAQAGLREFTATLVEQVQKSDLRLQELRIEAEETVEQAGISGWTERLEAVDLALATDPRYQATLEQRSVIAQQAAEMEAEARQIGVDAQVAGSGVLRTELAEVPTAPAQPRSALVAGIGGVVGLLLSVAFAWSRSGQWLEEPFVEERDAESFEPWPQPRPSTAGAMREGLPQTPQ